MRTHRKEKIASVIKHVVAEALVHRMQDPRINTFVTVTRVVVTGDLAIAKVYLSVQGDEATERRTVATLRHARGFLQREVAQVLSVRQCPEVRFEIDHAAKGARRTMELLEENRRREPELYEPVVDESETVEYDATASGPEQPGSSTPNGAGE
jgi:ribosome-binding factor A